MSKSKVTKYNNSLKGHSVAPTHPDGLPKEQGVKRHYKSEPSGLFTMV